MTAVRSRTTCTVASPANPITSARPGSGIPAEVRVRKHFLHRGHGAEFEMEAEWVQSFLPEHAGLVVDVGCGNGALFEAIGTDRVVGVDCCVDGLAHTRERYPNVPLVCADACNLPLADSVADALVAQHVIEHLPSHDAACGEWHRVLKPGGVLLVLTPNAPFIDPSIFHDETHVHIFDRQDLCQVVRRAGFAMLDIRTLGLPWFRCYRNIPSGWRLRRLVTRRAQWFSTVTAWRWKGQTLCCAAIRETD